MRHINANACLRTSTLRWQSARAVSGKINNYGCMNHLYDPIVNNPHDDWEHFQHFYQPIYNAKKTRFRLAEKGN